ncbi:MAG: VOC family protein [Dehalococcoidia bacterium]
MDKKAVLQGVSPYLVYEDLAAALDWLTRVLGFEEVARYLNPDGVVEEAEIHASGQEIWMGSMGAGYWQEIAVRPYQLIMVWVDDVDQHHARAAAGADAGPLEDKPYAVRMYTVTDPEGYQWGIAQRLDQQVQLEPGWSEVRPDGSIRTGPVS